MYFHPKKGINLKKIRKNKTLKPFRRKVRGSSQNYKEKSIFSCLRIDFKKI